VIPLALLSACGPWQRAGTPEPTHPGPEQVIPTIADPNAIFHAMGLITDATGGIGFVGTVRIYAGPSPDTMLVMTTLSLHNRGFAFHRDGDSFVGEYHVELALRQQAGVVQHVGRDERIRVSTFRETQRTDESVIFQQAMAVPAGQYTLAVTVHDVNGPATGHAEQPLAVPERRLPAVSMPLAVYQAHPRVHYADPLDLVPNPRNAGEYGSDTLHFYVEAYGLPSGAQLAVRAVDQDDRVAWSDSARVPDDSQVEALVVAVPTDRLSLGRYDLRLALGNDVLAAAPFLVSLSNQWIVGNFQDMISLLRYFPYVDTLRAVANGTPQQRAAAWKKMWQESDPDPATPENEALDLYFSRLEVANQRFQDEGVAGWLTERGEVLIGLGEPDNDVDLRPDIQGRGRTIEWTYDQYRLTLYFIDDTGFGRLRLDPASRSEFLRVLSRLQRG